MNEINISTEYDSNFINIEPEERNNSIYRIFSFERVIDIFKNNRIALVRPKLWDDPFENAILNGDVEFDLDSEDDVTEKASMGFRNSVYAQCWTWKKETDALWRIYSPEKRGVCLSTTPQKLLSTLIEDPDEKYPNLHCYIGKVEYLPEEEFFSIPRKIDIFDPSGAGIARCLLYKREEFSHESEVRLIWSGGNQESLEDIKIIKIQPHVIFDSIVFDPRIDDDIFMFYKNSLQKEFNIKCKIEKSELYKKPRKITVPFP